MLKINKHVKVADETITVRYSRIRFGTQSRRGEGCAQGAATGSLGGKDIYQLSVRFIFRVSQNLLLRKLAHPLIINGWKMKFLFEMNPFWGTFFHFRGVGSVVLEYVCWSLSYVLPTWELHGLNVWSTHPSKSDHQDDNYMFRFGDFNRNLHMPLESWERATPNVWICVGWLHPRHFTNRYQQ